MMKAGPGDQGESAGIVQGKAVIAMETTHYNSIKREGKNVKFIVLPVTVFMFYTYISMKSHHTKGSGRFSRDEAGRGRGTGFARESSFPPSSSKDQMKKPSKIFGVSAQMGEQLTHEESFQPVNIRDVTERVTPLGWAERHHLGWL